MAPWSIDQIPDLTGKVALVTGANSGIGFETARTLAARGADVVLACRSEAKALAAMAVIRATQPDARLEFLALDLSDLDAVRAAAAELARRHERLDILCNNAGVMGHASVQLTKQGFEMQFGTNHLGHFAFTGLLLGLLQEAPAARVVAVSSVAHKVPAGLNLDDPAYERTRYWHFDAYGRSKLANLLFMLELNRRARAAGLTLVAAGAHPGYSATNITSGTNQGRNPVKDVAVKIGNTLFGLSPQRGAMPTLLAATSPDIRGGEFIGVTGLFELWGLPGPVQPGKLAKDPALAAQLWEKSEAWTGISYLSS
jgi:NAD(P)-dependent dehydrogenase (short-subunit alcohol dehydrogenase family)